MIYDRLNGIIDRILCADSIDEVCHSCDEFCSLIDVDYYVYAAVIPTSLTQPAFIYFDNFPGNWRERYLAEDLSSVDPTLSHCLESSLPIEWQSLQLTSSVLTDKRDFFRMLDGIGVKSGASFPVHTAQGVRSMLSVASSQPYPGVEKVFSELKAYAQLFAIYVNESMIRLHEITPLVISDSPISDRERECLLWVAEGKTAWETGQILKIAERTVNFHINNVSNKLGAVNRQQAVARAITLGIIAPSMRRKDLPLSS